MKVDIGRSRSELQDAALRLLQEARERADDGPPPPAGTTPNLGVESVCVPVARCVAERGGEVF